MSTFRPVNAHFLFNNPVARAFSSAVTNHSYHGPPVVARPPLDGVDPRPGNLNTVQARRDGARLTESLSTLLSQRGAGPDPGTLRTAIGHALELRRSLATVFPTSSLQGERLDRTRTLAASIHEDLARLQQNPRAPEREQLLVGLGSKRIALLNELERL